MKLNISDVVKINDVFHEVVTITPHPEVPGSVYYNFADGYCERDCRLHPDAVYHRVQNQGADENTQTNANGPSTALNYIKKFDQQATNKQNVEVLTTKILLWKADRKIPLSDGDIISLIGRLNA